MRPERKGDRLERLSRGLEDRSPRELDHRLRAAIAFLKPVDFEIGRILRQVLERRLYRKLGVESLRALRPGKARSVAAHGA